MAEIKKDIIQCYENFKETMNVMFPGIVRFDNATLVPHEDFVEATITLQPQILIDNFLNMVDKNPNINILYAARNKSKKNYESLVYSLPVDGKMFIISLNSAMYGILNEMNVRFYHSLDKMFFKLKDKFYEIENTGWTVLEKEKALNLFQHFA